jgi:hypothetical protein
MTLLHKRYFLFRSWKRIAAEMGKSKQWVSDDLHKKALAQVQKVLDEREGDQDVS